MDTIRDFLSVNSVGPILLRAGIWFAVAIIVIASTDAANGQEMTKNLRSLLGSFLFFLVLCGGLIYLLFGFVPIV